MDLVDGRYLMTAVPHVAMRLKRVFSRANQRRTGEVAVVDTPETSRDLQWVMDRWPLDASEEVAAWIAKRAEEYRGREEAVRSVLDGTRVVDFGEPARPPRPHQLAPVGIVEATGRLLVADELGLGKSYMALLGMALPDALPALVVCMTHLPPQWLREIAATWPDLRCHVLRNTTPYDLRKAAGGEPDVIVCNYHKLHGWSDHLAGRVRTVIFDEAQELRRAKSLKYEAACVVAHHANWRWELTATPVYNYGDEIYNVLQVIAPDQLGSWPEFSREWCGRARLIGDPEALGLYLRDQGIMVRRTWDDLPVSERPGGGDPVRIPHVVDIEDETLDELTADVVSLAKTILSPDSGREAFQASGEFDWKLRQATGIAKAPYVAEFVNLLLDSEPVVLFGWHRAVYDVWAKRFAVHRPAFYTGTESVNQKEEARRRFIEGDTNLLIMSLRSGAGLDGIQERCRVAVFGELDWSPGIHNQCVGRLHRGLQTRQVLAYFLVAESGSDPVVSDVLQLKRQQSEPLIDPGKEHVTKSIDPNHVKRLARDFLARRKGTT